MFIACWPAVPVNFSCMDMHYLIKWLCNSFDGILTQGFDVGWDQREVACLKFLTPGIWHVYCMLTSYPNLEPTFTERASIAHCNGYVIHLLESYLKASMEGEPRINLRVCHSWLRKLSMFSSRWPAAQALSQFLLHGHSLSFASGI